MVVAPKLNKYLSEDLVLFSASALLLLPPPAFLGLPSAALPVRQQGESMEPALLLETDHLFGQSVEQEFLLRADDPPVNGLLFRSLRGEEKRSIGWRSLESAEKGEPVRVAETFCLCRSLWSFCLITSSLSALSSSCSSLWMEWTVRNSRMKSRLSSTPSHICTRKRSCL